MKTKLLLIITLFCIAKVISQEKNIETKSVSIENLIGFVVENYASKQDDVESEKRNITFLIQTVHSNNSIEDSVILKQAFILLSKRLTEDDVVSIITYSGVNGIALKQTSPKELKKVLYTLDNLKSSVKEFYDDGIELAYTYAKENFIETAKNSVVMIRNPQVSTSYNDANFIVTEETVKTKKKNNAILITAIALLPEIISVIKN